MKSARDKTRAHWWGEFPFDVGQSGLWEIASLAIAVTRHEREWRIQHREGATVEESAAPGWSVRVPADPLDGSAKVGRYIFREASHTVVVQPALADRPVVTRPVDPIHLQRGEQVTMFVSSPLWVNVRRADVAAPLLDVPVQRPSDTWFGPTTLHGEMCYAARTQARLSREDLPRREHRALTSVSIRNQGGQPLLLERLKLPVCQLSLFAGEAEGETSLWTNNLIIVAEEKLAVAEVQAETGPPRHLPNATLISKPRQPLESHGLQRALHALLG